MLVDIGQSRSDINQNIGPKLSDSGPSLTDVCPTSGELGPRLAGSRRDSGRYYGRRLTQTLAMLDPDFGPEFRRKLFVDLGPQLWPMSAKVAERLGKLGPTSAALDRLQPNLSALLGPDRPMSAGAGPSLANIGVD